MNALESRNFLDSTLIVFSSDHGDLLGDHGLPFKGNFYENSVNVPLIIAGPGVTSGEHCSSFIDWVDLHATFLTLAGINVPDHAQGNDISPLLKEPDKILKKYAISEHLGRAMIKTNDYKLVLCDDSSGEFYDLKEEPLEVNNHFNDNKYMEEKKDLERKLLLHMLFNSRFRAFGGGQHPSDVERDKAFIEIKEKVKKGEYRGL